MQRSCISLRSPASPSPHFTCVSSFSCSKRQFHCAALPCFVPGFRLVPLKIAASGARALLAMTNLVGLAGKWGSFRNEIFENRYEATPRKNDRIQQNASVFQIKTLQLCVIARPPCGRGNLKAKGMASRYEARGQKTTKFRNSDPSRRDTAIALHLGRYIIRPRGRISYAAAYIMQRSCISLRSPAAPISGFRAR